jgi:hypothetical protein
MNILAALTTNLKPASQFSQSHFGTSKQKQNSGKLQDHWSLQPARQIEVVQMCSCLITNEVYMSAKSVNYANNMNSWKFFTSSYLNDRLRDNTLYLQSEQ